MTSFSFSRQAQADPIGSNFGPTGGSGAIGVLEGQIVIDAQFDTRRSKIKESTNSTSTIFPTRDTKCFDILLGEIVFADKKKKNDDMINTGYAMVFSSLNNEGPDAMLLYPSNTRMQIESMLNGKKPIGIARSTVQFSNRLQNQGLSVQMAGKNYLLANVEMPIGHWAYVTVEDPSIVRNNSRTKSPFIPPEKVTMTLAPYTPETLSNRIHTHMKSYVTDQAIWEKAMNKDYAATDSWANFCENLKRHELMSFLLILDRFLKNNILAVNFANRADSPFDLRLRGGVGNPVTDNKNLILGLAKAFGILKDGLDNDLTQVNVSELHKRNYADLARECMLTIHCAEDFADFAYGYDPTSLRNDTVDSRNRTIKSNTSAGKMLMEQYQNSRNMYIAFADAVQRDNDRKFGLIGNPAKTGGTVQIIM